MNDRQQEIMDKLHSIVAPFMKQKREIGIESHLINDLALDSIDLVDVVIEIETAFKITVREKEINNFRVVGDIINFIDSKVEA